MKKKVFLFCTVVLCLFTAACSDDDSFSASPSALLTFSTDTVRLDTTFSKVSTATQSLWVYNHSGDGIRCTSVRLERGNQSGFRVNVDGTYLGVSQGFKVTDVEIRKNDSIRVFVEITPGYTYQDDPQLVEDNLVFTLESGVEQKVNLNAYAWDATLLQNVQISSDTTIASSKPIVVYGGLTVLEGAVLTIAEGTTVYFHADAGIDIYGTLKTEGTAESNVVLRGDRIDRMFDYLPYDRVSGQWEGIHIHSSSYGNEIRYTDIHSTFNGVVCDSADTSRQKLLLSHSTVHNCQGYGLYAANCQTVVEDCQLTNTLYACAAFNGGQAEMNGCTIAQYYPFDASRGPALLLANETALTSFVCRNSLVTGYADDVLTGEITDGTAFNYQFANCILRTPEVTGEDASHYENVTFEDVEDTLTTGKKHFSLLDTDNLIYDFRLSEVSSAIDAADPLTALPDDRNGLTRDEKPDIGAYERD